MSPVAGGACWKKTVTSTCSRCSCSCLIQLIGPFLRNIALWQVSFVASYPDAGDLITSTIPRAISTIIPPCPAARPLKSRVFRLKAGVPDVYIQGPFRINVTR